MLSKYCSSMKHTLNHVKLFRLLSCKSLWISFSLLPLSLPQLKGRLLTKINGVFSYNLTSFKNLTLISLLNYCNFYFDFVIHPLKSLPNAC